MVRLGRGYLVHHMLDPIQVTSRARSYPTLQVSLQVVM